VTAGPGLVGSLVVGVSAAKALSWAWDVPLVAVNHLQAHAFAPVLEGMPARYPFIALVVSGGHTVLAQFDDVDSLDVIGETQDDAMGEAFDKVAKYLGLGYPGGPVIEELSRSGDRDAIDFPRPMIRSGDFNFSFSGLKTAVVRYLDAMKDEGSEVSKEDVAASFQAAALEVAVEKSVRAAVERGIDRLVVGGGVACNGELRRLFTEACGVSGLELLFPSPGLCTDNAAMVAALGFTRYRNGHTAGLDLDVYPNLRLGEHLPDDPSNRKEASP
jgi:N6-L-threonylcarbamoyladenine synthase